MGADPVTGLRRSATTLVTLVAGAVVVAPLLVMAWTVWAEGSGRLADMLSAPGLGDAVAGTVGLAVAVTVLAVPVGTLLALALRHPDLPGRSFWRVAVLLPVIVPDFVLGYSWLRAYGRAGLVDDLLGLHWQGVQGPGGVAVVVAVNAVPLVYLVVAVGLAARAEPSTERAARASGAGSLTVLRTVTLPLLGPALATAALLVLVVTLGTFAIPQVMGSPAGFSTVTTRIYADLARSSDPLAFVEAVALALLLVVLAALVVAPADRLLGQRLRVARGGASTRGRPLPTPRRAGGRRSASPSTCWSPSECPCWRWCPRPLPAQRACRSRRPAGAWRTWRPCSACATGRPSAAASRSPRSRPPSWSCSEAAWQRSSAAAPATVWPPSSP